MTRHGHSTTILAYLLYSMVAGYQPRTVISMTEHFSFCNTAAVLGHLDMCSFSIDLFRIYVLRANTREIIPFCRFYIHNIFHYVSWATRLLYQQDKPNYLIPDQAALIYYNRPSTYNTGRYSKPLKRLYFPFIYFSPLIYLLLCEQYYFLFPKGLTQQARF